MKRILFFHFDLAGGGAEKVLINLLKGLDKTKYEITLFVIYDVGVNKSNLPQWIKYRYLFKYKFRGLTKIMKLFSPTFLYKLFIHDKYDIVISYLETSPTRIVSGCPDKITKKIAWFHTQLDDSSRLLNTYRSLDEAYSCYKKFDKIVFVSKFAEDNFRISTNWDLPTTTIYNTLDVKEILEKSLEPINLVLDSQKINFCSVGRFVYLKGYSRLLHVFGKLKHLGYVNFNLYLLGEGELLSEYEDIINSYGLNDHIHFLGYLSNPYKVVSKMDMFICSSYKEGFSTAVSESIIVGTPVLTTKCSGMDEILDNGKYGLIVDNTDEALYDGISNIIKNPNLIKKYRDLAKKRLSFFSTEQTILSVENLLDTI